MPAYTIGVPKRPDIKVPGFTGNQMQDIGEHAIQFMEERVATGTDVLDKPAPPLRPKYAKQKIRKGLPAVRDLRFSGNTLGSVQVLESDASHVKVGIRGATPYRKALFNQNIDPWFGLSERDDARVVDEVVRPIFSHNLADTLK